LEVVAHDIDRIWTEINKLKESAEEKSRKVLKPVRAKTTLL
jgi:hypothetical protein